MAITGAAPPPSAKRYPAENTPTSKETTTLRVANASKTAIIGGAIDQIPFGAQKDDSGNVAEVKGARIHASGTNKQIATKTTFFIMGIAQPAPIAPQNEFVLKTRGERFRPSL